jgi:uncharacterized protein (DUF1330 family)
MRPRSSRHASVCLAGRHFRTVGHPAVGGLAAGSIEAVEDAMTGRRPPRPSRGGTCRHLAAITVYEANVTDPEGYKNNFLKAVEPKLEKHGIRYLVRGGAPKALMGEPPKNRLVITQAKDLNAVTAFWNDSKTISETSLPSARTASDGMPPKALNNKLWAVVAKLRPSAEGWQGFGALAVPGKPHG